MSLSIGDTWTGAIGEKPGTHLHSHVLYLATHLQRSQLHGLLSILAMICFGQGLTRPPVSDTHIQSM